MSLGKDREWVRPDLVGGVSVRGDPVRADEHRVDLSRGEHPAGRGIGNEGMWHPCLGELPGREPGTLEIRSCLVDIDMDLAAGVEGGLDDP